MNKWKFFKDSEVKDLDLELVAMLDRARGLAGVPFVITSGFRSIQENTDCAGVSESAHLRGLAVDLRCDNSLDRYKMVKAFFDVGFKRVGIYNAHLHCDRDDSLPSPVLWTGISH